MPFPDELHPVVVVRYQDEWPDEFHRLGISLVDHLGDLALGADHVGSTAVPGLAAKNIIDVQVRCQDIDDPRLVAVMGSRGYRLRPEPWNRAEPAQGMTWPKLVFAAPVGARLVNIHLRASEAPTLRTALLFRDYLRMDDVARMAWGVFKQETAARVRDLGGYGAVKAPAWEILMIAAEAWAATREWKVPGPDVVSTRQAG